MNVGSAGTVVIVTACGELDLAAAAGLRDALLTACARTTDRVVVDCATVTFIDSTVLGVLAASAKRLATSEHHLQLTNVSPHVGRAIRLAGLWDYLGVSAQD